jgi:hypothetical protein
MLEQIVLACSVASMVSAYELLLTPAAPSHQCVRDLEAQSNILRVLGDSALLNPNNPIVARSRDILETDRDALPPLDLFLRTLLWTWPPMRSTDAATPGSWSARSRSKLGELFAAVDWTTVSAPLCPPYHAFVPGLGIVELTAEHLQSWRRSAAQ